MEQIGKVANWQLRIDSMKLQNGVCVVLYLFTTKSLNARF